ncbi:Dnaj heat shock n-terminal domain-containing protein [Thalictrum thalictroides]|uniref:Dnaj heat shock n-terminal domain-containing protein n=1 Tax=Thalictrum thalictroides TaxID=46969 RepID=A0A7J6X5B7_THATH|nr:Dnaj heat shock n-terminal domain-containing protein [Thalictrum thalictroides]
MSQQSKLEAMRCKEMAEKMINSEDYMGARDKLIQAKKLLPSLDNIESMLTVCDVLSAASLEFPGCKIDYYWILQLKPEANESDLRTQSQKLVSLLQPIKKIFPGTEMALQLVKSAFVMLSDREKRAVFDAKRVEGWDSFGSLYSKEFFDNASLNKDAIVFDKNKDVVVSAQSSSGNKRVSMSEVSDGSNGEAHAKRARHSEVDTVLVTADESRLNVIDIDRTENNMSSQMVTDTYRYKSGDIDRVEDGMIQLDPLALTDYAVDINSFDEQSSSDVSCVDHAPEYIPPMRPSLDTASLKLNWCRNDFSIGQVWAVYGGKDDMPRRYALINSVISNSQVRVTFLESHPVLDHEICWDKESLPIVCGIFRVGHSVHNLEMSWFSHSVKCQRSRTQSYYRIYPRKGEIWAMYTNWNKKWKQSEFNNYQYRVVEILDDFTDASGTRVARLVEVKGCMTFFQRHRYDGFELIRTVSKAEILSFSHRIPAFKVPGIERYDIPESSLHLEPDALPPRSKK